MWFLLAAAAPELNTLPVQFLPDPPAPSMAVIELAPVEITRVATRTQRALWDTPEAISVVKSRDIDDKSASTLAEAVTGLPNVAISGGPRAGGESINIRGLSGTRVLLSVDGTRQNYDGGHRSRLNIDPELLKTVEVLRGGASALYGSDALGGVIALTTKEAKDFLRKGESLYSQSRSGFESATGERKLGQTFAFSLAGFDVLADQTFRDTQDLRQGSGQRLAFSALDSGAGLYKASRSFGEHQFGFSHQRFRQQGQTPSNPANDITDTNPLLDRVNDQRYSGFNYGWGDRTRINVYRNQLNTVEDRVLLPRHDTLTFQTQGFSLQHSLPSLPAWLDSKFTLGSEAFRDQSSATRDGLPRPQFPNAQRVARAVFLQNEMLALPGLNVISGLRFDRFNFDSSQGESRQAQRLSPKLGLNYGLNEFVALQANVGGAFRAPSLLESYAQGQHFLGNEFRPNATLRPERARNLEVGFRLRLPNLPFGSFETKFSAFDNRVKDFIETVVAVESQFPAPQCVAASPPVGCVNRNADGSLNPQSVPVFVGGFTTSANLTQARLRGLEWESQYQWAGFNARASYSLTRGVNVDTGGALLNIPADQISVDVGYKLLPSLLPNVRLSGQLLHAFAQKRVPLVNGQPVVPTTNAYTLGNVGLIWEPKALFGSRAAKGLKLNLGLDNLSNRQYRRHLEAQAAAGRNARLSFSLPFSQ